MQATALAAPTVVVSPGFILCAFHDSAPTWRDNSDRHTPRWVMITSVTRLPQS